MLQNILDAAPLSAYDKAMNGKNAKKLVVYDFDNCLTDTNSAVAYGLKAATNSLCETFAIDPETLRQAIRQAKGQHRFCDYRGLSTYLNDEHNIPPKSGNPEIQQKIDQIRSLIEDTYFRQQRKNTVFYDGTLEALTSIREQGTAQVILTDAEAPALIRRLYFCARNSQMHPYEVLDLFDAFYCMPSIECDSSLLYDVDPRFSHLMKNKLVIATDRKWKPCPGRLQSVMEDFGTSVDETLMVGDSDKDLATGLWAGTDAAWFKHGVMLEDEVATFLKGYASASYSYGLADIIEKVKIATKGQSFTTLEKSLQELSDHFSFAPIESAYRHSFSSQACQTHLAQEDQTHIPTRPQALYLLFGAATHLCSTPETPAIPTLSGMADQETQALPTKPLQV